MAKHREPPFHHHITLAEGGLFSGTKVDVGACERVFMKCATGTVNKDTFEVMSSIDGNITFPSAPTIVKVSSTSLNDTAAGTGCQQIQLVGTDILHNEIKEVITLNGQTPVNTVQEFFRINNATGIAAGSSKTLEGNVYFGTGTVTSGVPATVFHVQDAGDLTNTAMYTVPKDKILLVTAVYFTTAFSRADSILNYKFKFELLDEGLIKTFANFTGSEDASVSNIDLSGAPVRVAEGVTIWVEASHNVVAYNGAASMILKGNLYPTLRETT